MSFDVPSDRSSSLVHVPVDTRMDCPVRLAVVGELRFLAWSVRLGCSNLEMESALFHIPGQCTTVILNCDRKSLILITARLMELCMYRRFR